MEIEMRSRDGTLSPFMVSTPVLELNGEPCAVALLRDIAEIKEMEGDLITAREAALAVSRAKSEFLSSMSHEIRTPMNAILGMAELLSETELDDSQRRFLNLINANSAALLELYNQQYPGFGEGRKWTPPNRRDPV
jgi:signal transduction histidine kinase